MNSESKPTSDQSLPGDNTAHESLGDTTWSHDSSTPEDPSSKESAAAVPLCLNCALPVDPLVHVCPHCYGAVGQYTSYMPWESIRWEADIWGRMWRQMMSPATSTGGRLLRLFVIVAMVPILLIGVVPVLWRWLHRDTSRLESTD